MSAVRKKVREREAKKRGALALFRGIVNKLLARDARSKVPEKVAVQQTVNRLTNWQRNQWAKAGYPGLGSRKKGYDPDASKIEPFARMQKHA